MARLNEPVAAPVETLDSLKRKFLRQNRDITKQNASQSIRIRALENELSKALSQNLQLREALNHAERIAESSKEIKMQLQNRMQEISALLTGIGNISTSNRRKSQEGGNTRSSPSPDQKNWKNRCTMSDAVNGPDGRLPAIMENKHYPRKTLEREEIMAIVETDIDNSPDIGPLPVSQFVDEDPVKIDLPVRSRNEETEESASLNPTLSINLEQRRKRKDSVLPSDFVQSQPIEEPRANQEPVVSMRSGAKRKLSVREDEEPMKSGTSSPDDFKYTRVSGEGGPQKTQPPSQNYARKTARDSEATKSSTKDKARTAPITASRKILAPKSVNDSPKKISRAISGDAKPGELEPIKPIFEKEPSREKKQEPVNIFEVAEPMLEAIEIQTIDVQDEPETPAPQEILSPLSSIPSIVPIQSRDTPPPTELGAENEGLRPSRRARGAVSYAEPNLRDKMRRPTKDLIDAVGSHGKPQKEVEIKIEDGANVIFQAPIESLIKPEPESDEAWKDMPVATSTTVENSPLSSKMTAPELLPSSITTHRRRRESLLNQVDTDSARPGSATAIANLLAETRKAKAAAQEKASQNVQPGIYEFKGSPPVPEEKTVRPPRVDRPAQPKYVPRRQSVVAAMRRSSSSSTPEDGETSDMESAKRQEVNRRHAGLSTRSTSISSFRQGDQESGRPLKKSTSTTSISDSGTAPRNDRISARRRSMML